MSKIKNFFSQVKVLPVLVVLLLVGAAVGGYFYFAAPPDVPDDTPPSLELGAVLFKGQAVMGGFVTYDEDDYKISDEVDFEDVLLRSGLHFYYTDKEDLTLKDLLDPGKCMNARVSTIPRTPVEPHRGVFFWTYGPGGERGMEERGFYLYPGVLADVDNVGITDPATFRIKPGRVFGLYAQNEVMANCFSDSLTPASDLPDFEEVEDGWFQVAIDRSNVGEFVKLVEAKLPTDTFLRSVWVQVLEASHRDAFYRAFPPLPGEPDLTELELEDDDYNVLWIRVANPAYYDDKVRCERAGFYWYDNDCHVEDEDVEDDVPVVPDDIVVIESVGTVSDVTVAHGTSETVAKGALASEVEVETEAADLKNVNLIWTIVDYDGDVAGPYNATGKLVLPEDWELAPGVDDFVTATVTVEAAPVVEVECPAVGDITGLTVSSTPGSDGKVNAVVSWGPVSGASHYDVSVTRIGAVQTQFQLSPTLLNMVYYGAVSTLSQFQLTPMIEPIVLEIDETLLTEALLTVVSCGKGISFSVCQEADLETDTNYRFEVKAWGTVNGKSCPLAEGSVTESFEAEELLTFDRDAFDIVVGEIDLRMATVEWKDASPLINYWAPYSAARYPQYTKDIDGVVHLRGLVKKTEYKLATNQTTDAVFYLPEGYRPAKHTALPCFVSHLNGTASSIYRCNVQTTGEVRVYTGLGGLIKRSVGGQSSETIDWVSLDGISFSTKADAEWEVADLGYGNSWTPYSVARRPMYTKDNDGVVHLRGLVKPGDDDDVFYLPEGYRPAKHTALPCFVSHSDGTASSIYRCNVQTTGEVRVYTGLGDRLERCVGNCKAGTIDWVSLDGISFSTKADAEWEVADLGYGNSWTPYSVARRPMYTKDNDGVVHLRGLVKPGDDDDVFYLPEGYRPAKHTALPCFASHSDGTASSIYRCNVQTTGEVRVYTGLGDRLERCVGNCKAGTIDWVSLDGISFSTR